MIETHLLTKRFGSFLAVDQVSLAIEPGTIFALLGPNGAGKTTTVRMLTSILAPSAGWARVAGFDVVRQPIEVRARVGVLTEQHGLYQRMKAIEYLDFFAQLYHLPDEQRRRRPLELMAHFGLADALGKRLGEYSKGMQQKLALARALLHDPAVLLLDEPTSAMDPQSARLVREAIRDLQRAERTIAITTHNLNEAQALADRIAVIRHGRIIAHGTFDSLAQRFVGPPLMELRLAQPCNGLAGDLNALVTVVDQGETWLRYKTTDPLADNPAVIRRLIALGADLVTLSEISRTLEDVYLQIVQEDEGHDRHVEPEPSS